MSGHGGKRAGAGRKAGVPNKVTQERQRAVSESGITPLDYLLEVLRDEENPKDMRLDAANKAAPYVHPKLAAITHTGKDGGPIETDNTHSGTVTVSDTAKFLEGLIGNGADRAPSEPGED